MKLRGLLSVFLATFGSMSVRAADLQAPVHPVDGSFVREWLVLGPFPGRDLETDFLAGVGGEANIRPKEGDTVTTQDGQQLAWTRFRSKHHVIELDRAFGVQQWSFAYVYCELNSDRSIETDIRAIGSYHAFLWLNGKKVAQTVMTRSLRRDDSIFTLPVRLNAGRNSCLLKVRVESRNHWAFGFQPLPPERAVAELQVIDPKGGPAPGVLLDRQRI